MQDAEEASPVPALSDEGAEAPQAAADEAAPSSGDDQSLVRATQRTTMYHCPVARLYWATV